MTLNLTFFSLALLLAGCDAGAGPPPEPGPDPVSTGSFTASLNGEPFEAPATFEISNDGTLAVLRATRTDSSQVPANEQTLTFRYDVARFVEGAALPARERVEGSTRVRGGRLSEGAADQVYNAWDPLDEGSTALRVIEVDSVAGRLRATVEIALVAASERTSDYQRLPDTLRFVGGEFVIGLAAE